MKKITALITGVTGGIGSVVAGRFMEAGYTVLGAASKSSPLQELSKNSMFSFRTCDIREKSQVADLFAQAEELFDISVVVNCAGVLILEPASTTSEEEWRKTMQTNVDGAFYVAQAATAMWMRQNKPGLVITIGSRWGVGSAKAPAYASSKAALKGLIASLQQENVSNGIRHVLLSPGSVLTDMSRSVDSKVGEEILDPNDIADCLLYLASTRPNVIFEEVTMKAYPYDYEH